MYCGARCSRRLLYFFLINPPYAVPAVAFGLLHISQRPIPQHCGIGAGIVGAAAVGAAVYLISTPQAAFEYCGIKPNAWIALVPIALGYAAYKLAPPYFPHRLLFAAAVATVATLFTPPVEFHPILSIYRKATLLALPILLAHLFLWRKRGGQLIVFGFLAYYVMIRVLIGIG